MKTATVRESARPSETIGSIELTGVAWREGSQWVSQCIELDIASSGATPEDAFEELKDAVCAYLNTLEELGERERVFELKGIQLLVPPVEGAFHPQVPREVIRREGAQVRSLELPVSGKVPAFA